MAANQRKPKFLRTFASRQQKKKMAKKKYYVVWNGAEPGIYASWKECEAQIKGYANALYKSFDSQEEAMRAAASPAHAYIGKQAKQAPTLPAAVEREALAVDAACSGNPGPMEYRGIYLRTGQEVFRFGPVWGTNNIGEFLAIVHALALLQQKGLTAMPVYSDSRNALGWVRQKRCRTKLPREPRTEALFGYIERAERWLCEHAYANPLVKWETDAWGEVPADFGRK